MSIKNVYVKSVGVDTIHVIGVVAGDNKKSQITVRQLRSAATTEELVAAVQAIVGDVIGTHIWCDQKILAYVFGTGSDIADVVHVRHDPDKVDAAYGLAWKAVDDLLEVV